MYQTVHTANKYTFSLTNSHL